MDIELIKLELEESVKKYKVNYLLDNVLKKEINEFLIEKVKQTKNKFFYMPYPYFEKENFNNGAYTLSYKYNHLLERDLYFYLPLTKYSSLKLFLLPKQENYDNLFDELMKNIETYKKNIIDFLNTYFLKIDDLINALTNKDISLFKSDFSPFLNKEIPNNHKILNLSISEDTLSLKIINKQTLNEKYYRFSLTNRSNEIYLPSEMLEIIKDRLRHEYLYTIKSFIRKEYFIHEIFRNLQMTFNDVDKNNIFDTEDYVFKINLESSNEDFLNDVLRTKNTIWLKKYLKKIYYKLLEKEKFFKDRNTRVKYINFIDNYIKKIRFTNDKDLENGEDIFFTGKNYNLDKLATFVLKNAKKNI